METNNGARAVEEARTSLIPKEDRQKRLREREAQRDYGRGRKVNTKTIKDKKLRRNLQALETKYKVAALKAKDAEILLEQTSGYIEPEHELERTYKVKQEEIQESVSVSTASKRFDLKLNELGPYTFDYTRNGRDILLAGRKGHIASMDWRSGKLHCEFQVNEIVRDARWLHSNQYMAVAQKKNVYIYDGQGVELHCLNQHREVSHLEFLPYHFLLATLGLNGFLKYQDVSTGQLVSEIATKLGPPASMALNPYNAVCLTGHNNGQIQLWSPSCSSSNGPLVKLLAHRGPVRAMSVDRGSILVPGAGEPNMDVMEANPFETVKERQDNEVKSLLNKLQPEMIALDPTFIGNLDLRSEQQREAERDLDAKPVDVETEIRNKMRGKNSALRRYLRKQRGKNVIDEKRLKVDEIWKEQVQQRDQKKKEKEVDLGPALSRFAKKD